MRRGRPSVPWTGGVWERRGGADGFPWLGKVKYQAVKKNGMVFECVSWTAKGGMGR